MIEDAELRSLFQAESEERLQHLEDGLKQLEEDPSDSEVLEEIFRDAHTVKGSARMLGIISIEQVAHSLEDGLDVARRAKIPLTSAMFRILYEGIDGIRLLVDEAVTGKKSAIDASSLLARAGELANEVEKELSKDSTAGTPSATSVVKPPETQVEPPNTNLPPLKTPEQPPPPTTPAPSMLPTSVSQPTTKEKPLLHPDKPLEVKKTSSTIRIDTQQINDLLTQAADLTVAKNRILRLLEQIEEMLEFWEKKNRSIAQLTTEPSIGLASPEAALKDRVEMTSELTDTLKRIVDSLSLLRDDSYGDIHKLEGIASSFVDRIRKLTLVPLSKLFDLFPRMVQDVARTCNKEVEFIMEGGEITVDKKIIEEMKDPIMHLLRNSISHGIESPDRRQMMNKPRKGVIHLKARQTSNNIIIEVIDDGKGINNDDIIAKALEKNLFSEAELQSMSPAQIQSIIFMPGFSTASQISDISGRGVGLDVVQNYMKKLNGNVQVDSEVGKGCKFTIQLAITLINTHVMLFQSDKRPYAVPIDLVESCNLISPDRLSTIEGHDVIFFHETPISVVPLKNLVGVQTANESSPDLSEPTSFACAVLKSSDKRLALLVDAILDEQKVVVTPPGRLCYGLRWLIGTTILKTGEVCVIINPFELLQASAMSATSFSKIKKQKQDMQKRKKRILLVDDSYTIRLMISRVLENEGYEVLQAFNGIEGLKLLEDNKVDAIISDVEMPELDGLGMVSRIRQQKDLYSIPIILISTKATIEDRQKGFEAGANVYLAKSEYNQSHLIKTLREFFV